MSWCLSPFAFFSSYLFLSGSMAEAITGRPPQPNLSERHHTERVDNSMMNDSIARGACSFSSSACPGGGAERCRDTLVLCCPGWSVFLLSIFPFGLP
ncbi:hypothetical protein V8C44DRAFT_328564 [Trichoderma aethiopicum]